jgi:hypothetical protein
MSDENIEGITKNSTDITDKQIDSRVLSMMNLAYRVNQETDFFVSFNFCGHTDEISIEIRRNKRGGHNEIATCEFFIHHPTTTLSSLDKKISILKKILKTSNIPYDDIKSAHKRAEFKWI